MRTAADINELDRYSSMATCTERRFRIERCGLGCNGALPGQSTCRTRRGHDARGRPGRRAGRGAATAAGITPGQQRTTQEILSAARRLASCSPDGSFTLMQVIAELRRPGTRYTESTIRTHVTSRMRADSPDHQATTYDDLERMDRARCRLRRN
jgi:hypothetical protein